MKSILRLCNISKKFGNFEALKSINLELQPGEIHGLVGENGAGKSTLLSILYGNAAIRESGGYAGEIFIDEKKVNIQAASEAVSLGIGMVHQEFALIPNMTVTENITIGREEIVPFTQKMFGTTLGFLDKEKNTQKAKAIIEKLDLNIDTKAIILNLSVNIKQFIEIAREISKEDLKILILDEPTAALSENDTERLFPVLRELAAQGIAIIFVSHRLEEVVSLCHRITVLRDGEIAGSYTGDNCSTAELAKSMIGRPIIQTTSGKRIISTETVLEFINYSVNMLGENIHDLNLNVYKGEILGIAGLSGHGKLALGNGVMGIYPSTGRLIKNGLEVDTSSTAKIIASGIYFLPEDRRQSGLLLDHSIEDNIVFLAMQQKNKFLKSYLFNLINLLDKQHSLSFSEYCLKKLDIRCRNVHQKVRYLSGGNQQKVCLARVIAVEPEVLFVSEPTRGVDIGAKEKILKTLLEVNADLGTTIILTSSDLGDLKRICDRIVVMFEGRVLNILSPDCSDLHFAMAFSGEWPIESNQLSVTN